MNTKILFEGIDCKEVYNLPKEILGVCFDSAKVKFGDVFVCLNGSNSDGHNFALEAQKNGATLIVCQKKLEGVNSYVIVENTRKTFALLCANFWQNPSKKMHLIGVTGTNGKTTTTHLVYNILNRSGKPCGLIGTNGAFYGGQCIQTDMTTPDPFELNKILSTMLSSGINYCAIEVSAHALAFFKIAGIKFEVGALTNITEDHLDFFENMQNYADAKLSFFSEDYVMSIVNNSDDEISNKYFSSCKIPSISYALNSPCDVFASNIETTIAGTSFYVNFMDTISQVKTNLVGQYNVYNILCAICITSLLGVGLNVSVDALKEIESPLGRFNVYRLKSGASVVIDYAHTPDGLENLLACIKNLPHNKLICVFGCGGNRDRQKRPIMGKIASKLADITIVTSDNPRFESRLDIINDIIAGIDKSEYLTIADRKKAIVKACKIAGNGDIIAICGKGCEDYIDEKGKKRPWLDANAIKNFIKNKRK